MYSALPRRSISSSNKEAGGELILQEGYMNVEALVFDLFGTLVDVRSVEAACAEETPDPRAFVALWRQKQLEYSWLRALMGRYEDFWAVTTAALDYSIERLKVDAGDAARRRLLEAWLTVSPYPETTAALARLPPRPLAVLSNGSPHMLEQVLRSAGLRDRFAHVLSVEEVRTYKPAPAVYALAERHVGLPRERLLFVSSNAWDVAGARAFGLPVAWVNRAGGPPERLGAGPDLTVRDLAELADQVTG
jgi:2-haloacid dehalogenase